MYMYIIQTKNFKNCKYSSINQLLMFSLSKFIHIYKYTTDIGSSNLLILNKVQYQDL